MNSPALNLLPKGSPTILNDLAICHMSYQLPMSSKNRSHSPDKDQLYAKTAKVLMLLKHRDQDAAVYSLVGMER